NISSLTLAVSSATYQAMVNEILSLQQRIIGMALQERRAEQVYQLNFQLYPVTVAQESNDEK
ncbi:MAG: DUF4423 domain-containing protein, partial [Chitinivibrionales bacterium]|nr:DUF4423 domain-containing protein [Chitinivibrionales bacterium]